MYCLAGIGGQVSGIVKTTEAAPKILAIDGCPLNCAKHSLEQAGIRAFEHLRLADLGLRKGCAPVVDENVAKVVAAGAAALSRGCGCEAGTVCPNTDTTMDQE